VTPEQKIMQLLYLLKMATLRGFRFCGSVIQFDTYKEQLLEILNLVDTDVEKHATVDGWIKAFLLNHDFAKVVYGDKYIRIESPEQNVRLSGQAWKCHVMMAVISEDILSYTTNNCIQ